MKKRRSFVLYCSTGIIIVLLFLGGYIMRHTSNAQSILAPEDVYAYLGNNEVSPRTAEVILSQTGITATYVYYFPMAFNGSLISTTTTVVQLQPQLLNISGRGATWQEAWENPDVANAGSYGVDASVVPNYDLEIPPIDYLIGRTYLSFLAAELDGNIVAARLILPDGCQAISFGNMAQPDTYHVVAGAWEGPLSDQGEIATLWYPPQYNGGNILGQIPPASCNEQTPVTVHLNITETFDVLNLVIIHPDEGSDLRSQNNNDGENGVAIRSGNLPFLELEMEVSP